MKIEVTHHVYLHNGKGNDPVVELLKQVLKKEDEIMASIQDVKAQVAAKAAEVRTAISAAIADEKAEVTAAIQKLKDQIEAGGTVSAADLDEILASVGGIGSGVVEEVEALHEDEA